MQNRENKKNVNIGKRNVKYKRNDKHKNGKTQCNIVITSKAKNMKIQSETRKQENKE